MGGVEGVEKRRREGDQRATGSLKRNSRRREGEGRKRKFGEGRKEKGKFALLLSAENTGKRRDLKPLDLMKRVGRVFVMEGASGGVPPERRWKKHTLLWRDLNLLKEHDCNYFRKCFTSTRT